MHIYITHVVTAEFQYQVSKIVVFEEPQKPNNIFLVQVPMDANFGLKLK